MSEGKKKIFRFTENDFKVLNRLKEKTGLFGVDCIRLGMDTFLTDIERANLNALNKVKEIKERRKSMYTRFSRMGSHCSGGEKSV